MELAAERRVSETSRLSQTDLGRSFGEVIVIPANFLKLVAKKLTEETLQDKAVWQHERAPYEYFKFNRGPAAFHVKYREGRVPENMIQFVVMDHAGTEIGSLVASEDDKESYEPLSILLFAIQLQEGRGSFEPVINELFKMLPEKEREQWVREPPRSE